MRYLSTRGLAPPVSFLDAVLAGMAPDGGLYVPESWPQSIFGAGPIRPALDTFAETARVILAAFAGADLSPEEAAQLADEAYWSPTVASAETARRWPPAVTPLVQIDSGDWILELFRGPSLSFKDLAMQLIGALYDLALSKRNLRLSVVCATSGDTGGAAVEALKGRERVDLFVLLPKGRVSDVQRRFMTASGAENVHAIEIAGDFDDCQRIVKAMFSDRDFALRAALSGVNSINWARILAQSIYFHVAAAALSAAGPVAFVVPTGNFGDAFSGFVAKKTGASIGKIVLATNSNDILARALATGRYDRAPRSHATVSPAMDIQVASNFERILFEAMRRDGEAVRRLYERFSQSGEFDIPPHALDYLRTEFSAGSATDAETLETMRSRWSGGDGYMMCPHTAVGVHVGAGSDAARVFLATAHPAKFPDTVERATGVRPSLPPKFADMLERPERMDVAPNDAEAVKQYIRERSRAWS
ncbi:MAG: threonine synthase [Phycisphaerales bacterium]|nr:threonine synthase [Hyphomonadaceae bacterium]